MDDARHFVSCDYETSESVARCPRCGQGMFSPKKFRTLGWILAGIGSFLVVFMAAITFIVADIMTESGKPGSTTTFTGTRADAVTMFAIFGAVIAAGLLALAAGVMQARIGRPSR